jgi:hypothetical protein
LLPPPLSLLGVDVSAAAVVEATAVGTSAVAAMPLAGGSVMLPMLLLFPAVSSVGGAAAVADASARSAAGLGTLLAVGDLTVRDWDGLVAPHRHGGGGPDVQQRARGRQKVHVRGVPLIG